MSETIKHIFLVDDDEDDRLFFVEAMEEIQPSLICTLAINGKKALQKLETLIELPDLIFLDINMPELNGFECLRELKKSIRFRNIPIIMLSTSVSHKDIDHSIELGASMFFTKPSSYTKLCALLRKVLAAFQG